MGSFESTENKSSMDHSGIMMEVNQAGGNPESQLSSDDLSIRVVLGKILENFSSNELRELSLVSKLWHSEARSIMAKRGSLIAVFRTRSSFPRDLGTFVSDLQGMNPDLISFCGIKISLGECSCSFDVLRPPLDLSCDAILDRLKWRNLSIVLWETAEPPRDCPCFQLLDQIFKEKCRDLVEIDLVLHDNLGRSFFEQAIQNSIFPRLQTLKIHASDHSIELNFVRALVSRAPALQKVYGSEMTFKENLADGSSAALVPTFVFTTDSIFSYEDVIPTWKISVESLSLQVRYLEYYQPAWDLKTFNRVMPVLLKNSCYTLKSVTMDLLTLLPLMNYGVVLRRVRELKICTYEAILEWYQPEILDLFKAFNFTRIFPSLSKVQFQSSGWDSCPSRRIETAHDRTDLPKRFVSEGNAAVWEYEPDRASRIKHLELRGRGTCESKAVKFFAHMFPNIQTLSIIGSKAKIPCGINREQWVNLEEISFG